MFTWVLLALAILIVSYFGLGLYVATRLTAPSNEPMAATPASVGLKFREVSLRSTDGVRLSAWWVPKKGASRAVILVHGWGGNKSNEQILKTAPIYARAGYNVLMMDLRGHGQSEAVRRTLGYQETRDVRGALGWLEKKGFGPGEIVLHGWSMGAATVVRSAPGTGVAAVVEDSGYADLPLLLNRSLPENSGLPSFFNFGTMLMAKVFLDFDAWAVVPYHQASELAKSGTTLFIIHSTTDQTVPFEQARLFRKADPKAAFWKLEGYEHVDSYTAPDYREKLLDFLRELKAKEAA